MSDVSSIIVWGIMVKFVMDMLAYGLLAPHHYTRRIWIKDGNIPLISDYFNMVINIFIKKKTYDMYTPLGKKCKKILNFLYFILISILMFEVVIGTVIVVIIGMLWSLFMIEHDEPITIKMIISEIKKARAS